MLSIPRLALTTALAAILPTIALAADYDPPIYVEEAPEVVPVEIGSGWYLRGDISYNAARNFRNRFTDVSSPGLVNGVVSLGSLFPMQDVSFREKETPVHVSIGAGYHINDYLRIDANLGKFADTSYSFSGSLPNDFSASAGCSGTFVSRIQTLNGVGMPVGDPTFASGDAIIPCTGAGNVTNSAWDGMVNAYVDLGTFAGFTPYIGAGAGVYYAKSAVSASVTCEGAEETVIVPGSRADTTYLCTGQDAIDDPAVVIGNVNYSDRSYDLMYSLNAGVSYQVSQNASIDLGYQYRAVPNTHYYTVGEQGIEAHKGIDFHQIKLGFRYDLW